MVKRQLDTSTASVSEPRRRSVRRIIANLLIVAGLLALLYPVGTWLYTRVQQAGLARTLASEHPDMEAKAREFFQRGTTSAAPMTTAPSESGTGIEVPVEHDAPRQAAAREQRAAADRALHDAALAFARSVGDQAGKPIGRLVIPKIGVDVVLLEGVGTQDLREGPGHWPETPFPGLGGNFVVSGHRTTYGAPFFRLDRLEVGDEIQLALPYVAAVYRVWRVIIVSPEETYTVRQRGVEELSLATCHPIYSAEQRLVVQALMVDYQLLDSGEAGG